MTRTYFRKLDPDHHIFKTCRLLGVNDNVYAIESESGKELIFWMHGSGLIPLHHEKSIREEFEYRIHLKEMLHAV